MSLEGSINIFDADNNYWLKLVGFLIGIIVLGVTCFIDDSKGIPSWVKLIAQVGAAIIVAVCGIRIENINLPFIDNKIFFYEWFSYIITVGWIVGITNAINLIDGLDGLSSGITLISCVSLLIIFLLTPSSPLISILLITALAGSIVGFLPFNFSPAKTFIGDVGSNFLGFSLAVISILGVAKTYTALVLIAPIIVLGLPIFDTIFAIIRRIIKGKSIKAVFKADKGHLHHRLMKRGYTQKQAVLILYGLTATLGMFAIILLESGIWKALSFALLVIAIIAIGYKDIFRVKQDDIEKNVFHEDGSATTTWSIDLHFPDPKNSKHFPGNEFKAETKHINIYPYPIPYRCLYSRNIDNLFMAGRNISVTHVALGTTRVMRTTGMMGEVVGMAASLCKKYNTFPRQIYFYHLNALKALMTQGVGNKELPNNQVFNLGGTLSTPQPFPNR